MRPHLRIFHSQEAPARAGWPLLTFCSLDISLLGRHSLLGHHPPLVRPRARSPCHSPQPSPTPATPAYTSTTAAEGSKGKGSPGAPPILPQLKEASLFEHIAKSSSFPAQSYGSSPLAGPAPVRPPGEEDEGETRSSLPANQPLSLLKSAPAQVTVQSVREMTRLSKSQHDLSSRCRGRGRKAGDVPHAFSLVGASAVPRRGEGVQNKLIRAGQ